MRTVINLKYKVKYSSKSSGLKLTLKVQFQGIAKTQNTLQPQNFLLKTLGSTIEGNIKCDCLKI